MVGPIVVVDIFLPQILPESLTTGQYSSLTVASSWTQTGARCATSDEALTGAPKSTLLAAKADLGIPHIGGEGFTG